jgi:hypothetical protein
MICDVGEMGETCSIQFCLGKIIYKDVNGKKISNSLNNVNELVHDIKPSRGCL